MQLLNKISNTSPDVTFHYSGDFDLQGLRIAAHLLSRYPRHTPANSGALIPPSYMRAARGHVASLQICPMFSSSNRCHTVKGKAYQEGIASLLIEDIQHSLE